MARSGMLRNVDRFASAECRRLSVGQLVRMPVQYLGRADRWGCRHIVNSRESYVVESFPGRGVVRECGRPGRRFGIVADNFAHCVNLRRLSDGRRVRISQFWIARYAED